MTDIGLYERRALENERRELETRLARLTPWEARRLDTLNRILGPRDLATDFLDRISGSKHD